MVESPFSDNKEYFVFQCVGQGNTAQLQAAHPSGHFVVAHRVEDISELVRFRLAVRGSVLSPETVEFFIVVILYLFAYGS